MIINDLFNNKKTAVAEGSKMARADKSAKTPKPEDQQEYNDIEKYRKDLAQSYNKEPNFGIKDDEEENKWWIDYDLDEGMAEAFANPGSGSTRLSSRGEKRIANIVRKALAKNSETPDQIAARKDFEAQTDARMRQKKKEQGVAEVSLGDYRKKAAVSQAGAKINKFFDRDDPAKVAAADQTIAKRERGLARANARTRPYTPPPAAPADLEKQQRDLTAKYPNIDELVRRAELNRDPDYEMADGEAYYAARDAEQNYQKLRQIQRVIQGLNESLQRTQP